MEPFKHDLDVLFSNSKKHQEVLLSSDEVSEEQKEMIKCFDKLELEEDYEFFLGELMNNGQNLFNPFRVITVTTALLLKGEQELADSYNAIGRLYYSLNKIQL